MPTKKSVTSMVILFISHCQLRIACGDGTDQFL